MNATLRKHSIYISKFDWSATVGLNKINRTKDCFVAEIKERELMSKRLSKYIASFDYFDKSLFDL